MKLLSWGMGLKIKMKIELPHLYPGHHREKKWIVGSNMIMHVDALFFYCIFKGALRKASPLFFLIDFSLKFKIR